MRRLTTVSPSYAREIQTPEYCAGLDGVLRSRANDLVGILNGVDYSVWDPANDTNLRECYDRNCMTGKPICKAAIQVELGLDQSDDIPRIRRWATSCCRLCQPCWISESGWSCTAMVIRICRMHLSLLHLAVPRSFPFGPAITSRSHIVCTQLPTLRSLQRASSRAG